MKQENPTRFKLKLGAAEIEFEGSPEFLKAEVMPTVEKLLMIVESRAEFQPTTRVLDSLPSNGQHLANPIHVDSNIDDEPTSSSQNIPEKQIASLATFLKSKEAGNNQVQRFLATAGWLHKKGKREITTTLVGETLLEHQQTKLGNPAECLNQNVRKGHCEKTKTGFFVTPEGWLHLGETK
jgi:hypothetical protein